MVVGEFVRRLTTRQESFFVVRTKPKPKDRVRAEQEVIRAVISGELVALGREPDSREFQIIDPMYFIGAELDESGCLVRSGHRTHVDVRLDRFFSQQSEAAEVPSRPGRPTEGALIMDAIRNYVSETGNTRLKGDVSGRNDSYRRYLKKRGYTLGGERFKPTTIQSYETIFRNKNK